MEILNNTIEIMGHSILILASGCLLGVGFLTYRIIKDGNDLTKKIKDLNKD